MHSRRACRRAGDGAPYVEHSLRPAQLDDSVYSIRCSNGRAQREGPPSNDPLKSAADSPCRLSRS
ncbi:hypothetical protein D7V80_00315 [Corallococcus sp. CA054B]|nr:hypothetical protein D7V80_00315 [Corallococcus sp. CA054B]